jgi:predicted RNA-binding Zn-ribbon protein involved in translation (DUF1610 family)
MASNTKKKCPTCGFEGDIEKFVPLNAKKNFQKNAKGTSEKKFLTCPNCGTYVGIIPKERA